MCASAYLTIQAAAAAGATDEQLAEARLLIREGQWYWDWLAAENSYGFHNTDKLMKAGALAIDCAHRAIEAARMLAPNAPLAPMPVYVEAEHWNAAQHPGENPPAEGQAAM